MADVNIFSEEGRKEFFNESGPRLWKGLQMLKEKEDWTLDEIEEVKESLIILGNKIRDKHGIDVDPRNTESSRINEDEMIYITAYLGIDNMLILTKYILPVNSQDFIKKCLDRASKILDENEHPYFSQAGLFVERFKTVYKANVMGNIFNEERLEFIKSSLSETHNKEVSQS
jgi:hypothetical protein